jgi:hypothetical protein
MLKIGDIVQLNSGGLEMTVVDCDGKNATVTYETEDSFPVPCLRKVEQRGFLGRFRSLWAKGRYWAKPLASRTWSRILSLGL